MMESVKSVAKGVVYYNRRDLLDWALQEQYTYLLSQICFAAAREGRIYLLDEVWNITDEEDFETYIVGDVNGYAAIHDRLEVLKWLETKGSYIDKDWCARGAAFGGQLHIIQWLREEYGLKLFGELYDNAAIGNQLHFLRWLREQEVDWGERTFVDAAEKGNLDILQWLHNEGCPWPD
eukprot:CAMPEP_0178960274 /NCGR_PEP_ID=MMETSP0789-20121207/12869_1 /TAXON_ID=3005 /ORGANISM="Rhizosolenia setigera, Strain CCMP 1694" /LENGTH=177 /DNA_ID=CAMNT_0020643597 /DNA_START=92 /DNA_END=623 /DNA_ORIENTATION=+